MWNIKVVLPDQYPFKAPSVQFINRMFHPNIHEEFGSICVDALGETWTPLYGKSFSQYMNVYVIIWGETHSIHYIFLLLSSIKNIILWKILFFGFFYLALKAL